MSVDVALAVPAPEDEAAPEPAAAESETRGPVVQELDLTLDNPTDRAIFQLGTLLIELKSAIQPFKNKTFAISSENGNMRILSENTTILRQWK